MLTKQELEAIKERCEKATGGTWGATADLNGSGWVMSGDTVVGTFLRKEDGEFLAHSRQEIPKLLNDIELLQTELSAAKSALRECTEKRDLSDKVRILYRSYHNATGTEDDMYGRR